MPRAMPMIVNHQVEGSDPKNHWATTRNASENSAVGQMHFSPKNSIYRYQKSNDI